MIDNLQQRKAALIDDVLDTQATFISKLTEEEIMDLFKQKLSIKYQPKT